MEPRAQAVCWIVMWLVELTEPTFRCDRCGQDVAFAFGRSHVWWLFPVPMRRNHSAPCGLPCFDAGWFWNDDGEVHTQRRCSVCDVRFR